MFDIERTIIAVEMGQDAGELEDVDYQENIEILTDQEQRNKWDWELSKGLIDLADIMMQKNPDLTREEAEEILAEKKPQLTDQNETEEKESNPLLEALQSYEEE